jgi:3-hydroxybutyryl-CoA dehydratase
VNDYRWNDLAVGMAASFEVTLTAEMVDAFSELSGDVNPLHMNEEFAQACGFPHRVAFGMLTASFYSRLVGMYLPGRRAFLHGIDVDFHEPIFIGDRLAVSGEVVHLTDAYHRLELKARIQNQRAQLISKATVRVGVHDS